MSKTNKVKNAMKVNNKVVNAVSKTAKQLPIIAWAVEADGIIDPTDVYTTRASARYLRNEMTALELAQRAHVRKVVMYVIPGR